MPAAGEEGRRGTPPMPPFAFPAYAASKNFSCRGELATISVRPIDYIGRPATADLLVCPPHAEALKARAAGKGIHVSTP